MKACKVCGGIYPEEVFFRRKTVRVLSQRVGTKIYRPYRSICDGCVQDAKDKRKEANRPLQKARSTYNRHANNFVKKGIIKHRDELRDIYGWHVPKMTHDIEFHFENGCPYCGRRFADMPNGLSDMTLDIINPALPPHYATNVKWVCMTDNREKSKLPPDIWSRRLIAWDEWWKRQEKIAINPWAVLPLFDNLDNASQPTLFDMENWQD